MAALLRDVPGVEIVEKGIERISIRGESSRRVAVLIDGQKLTDHSDYGQPVLIDPASIERIEIARGSSSVARTTAGNRQLLADVGAVIEQLVSRELDRMTAPGAAGGGGRAAAPPVTRQSDPMAGSLTPRRSDGPDDLEVAHEINVTPLSTSCWCC